MNDLTKNRVLTLLVVFLIVANATSIAMFWFGKEKQKEQRKRPKEPQGKPQDFLIK